MRLKWTVIGMLLALCLFAQSLAFADDDAKPDVFKGTIGQAAVVMSLYAEASWGNYFYEKYKRDIVLRGSVKGHDYQLFEGLDDDGDRTANQMQLHRDGTHLTGTYTSAKGKTLPVVLELVPSGSVPEPRPDLKLEADDAGKLLAGGDYNRLRLAGLQLAPQKKETFDGGYTIQWYLEPRSGERLFRLVAGWPQAAMTAINTQLEAEQFNNALASLGCAGMGQTPSEVTLERVDSQFLSAMISASWSCEGAAHPNAGVYGITFDTRTGQELSLNDLWWLGKGAKPKKDSDADMDYQDKVFAPTVVHLLTQWHPKEMSKPTDEDACDYSDPQVWNLVTYWLTDDGLELYPSFNHAQEGCQSDTDWAVIPYGVLEKANPALYGKLAK
ncbi:hypothetical protein [Dyella mobilis]|uniref:DUF3298 domain-containing protein n=1 Tax=Dyella mobilis TaxID=1849582 RepID=A0ABS2KJM2_9GAMM|nr:hypothetical protein [Dyella mobilis]MBM7131240.1 hypothetical protein [Dyella mobilis]GLQ98823.1 hypothetical protein GCM10007863_32430 [Dyella mobilis]